MISAVVVGAGRGKRFRNKKKNTLKIFLKLKGKPLIFYSLLALNRHPRISEIILVTRKSYFKKIKKIIRRYNFYKVKKIVSGGKERQDSVLNGLKFVNSDSRFVLIHDAARPFLNPKLISSCLRIAQRYGSSVAAVPVKNTIKQVKDGIVERTLPREELWETQTPQVFKKELLFQAYFSKKNYIKATDDSTLVERLGKKVAVVFASYSNIKITTYEDLLLAKEIIKNIKWLK